MAISIMDIQNREFERSFRGYNVDDVDDFLENLALEYDTVVKENRELQEHLEKLKKEKEHFIQVKEDSAREADEVKEESEKVRREADAEIEKIRDETEKEIERISYEHKKISRENEELRQQIIELKKEGMGFDKIEDTIQNAISRSQEAAEEVLANARKEAEEIKETADTYRREAEEFKSRASDETVQLRKDYENLQSENQKLMTEIHELTERNKKYEQLETTVQNAILKAQEEADELRKKANKDAAIIREEAEKKSRLIISEAESKSAGIIKEHEGLQKQIQDFKNRFRSFLEKQLSSLEKGGKTVNFENLKDNAESQQDSRED